jgi:hypothetical protein
MCGNEERAVCAFTDLQALFLVPFHFLTPFFGVSKKMIQTPGKSARTAEVSRAIALAAEGTQGINAPPGETSRIDRNSNRMTGLLINPAPSLADRADRRPEVVLPPFQDTVYLFGLTVVGGAEMPSSSCYGLRRPL